MHGYPKRLIEVDLPIARISAHARREKSIRHGHISTLHIWWARRPLAACRAVICAALWPDPVDVTAEQVEAARKEGKSLTENYCPPAFREAAVRVLTAFAKRVFPEGITEEKRHLQETAESGTLARWEAMASGKAVLDPANPAHQNILRYALLDFIADFANWDNSTAPAYLETARALTQAAHEALGGEPGTRPLVVDPFAGGGSIPLEALRVGADAFASDLNPVAVLLNKVVLEYIPKYGQQLADEVRKWGQWIKEQAEKELAEFYPKDPDGATPIAYLWARTIRCEGAGCGAEVPLMRSLWLAKKANKSVALKLVPRPKAKRVDFEIIHEAGPKDVAVGTVKRGSATCPCCGYTTPVKSVREQLKKRRGGAADARLFCVVTTRPKEQGRFYRLPNERDLEAVEKAAKELERRKKEHDGPLSLVPEESLPEQGTLGFRVQLYGMVRWGDLFTPRQLLTLTTLTKLVTEATSRLAMESQQSITEAVQAVLAIALSRVTDICNMWETTKTQVRHLFTRQAVPMLWDFGEPSGLTDAAGNYWVTLQTIAEFLVRASMDTRPGHAELASALSHPLPDDGASGFVTDPPYYDAVPYGDLSDFFYVWLKRTLPSSLKGLFNTHLAPGAG